MAEEQQGGDNVPKEGEPEAPKEEEKSEEEEGENSSDSISLSDANKIAERLEVANIERMRLLDREEKLHAQRVLGGKSSAGQTPEPKKEPTDQEYAAAAIKGELPTK